MSSKSSAAEAPASAPESAKAEAAEEKAAAQEKKDGASGERPSDLANDFLLRQIRAAVELARNATPEEKAHAWQETLELARRLQPKDAFEGLLVAQMVAAHSAAMRCMRLSAHFVGDDHRNLNLATKLMSLFARQGEVLDKHRGKGEQKVTVKHVHVGVDGRVAVGNAHRRNASGRVNPSARPAVKANPASSGNVA